MDKFIKQAFTLIELLVVIAIIGILSGLIVVSMGGMTTKATIAKAQVFSNSLRNALMLDLVSEWKFDGTLTDSWNGGNNGTWYSPINSSAANYRPSTECISGQCLSFDGTDDYVAINDKNNLDIVSKMTIAIWVKKVNSTTLGKGILTKEGLGGYTLVLDYITADSKISFVAPTIDSRKMSNALDDNWHCIVLTIDESSNSLKFYLDGNLDSSQTATGTLAANTSNILLGYRSNYFSGLMDEIRIYSDVIPTSQIKENYYSGLNSLFANGNINKQEYNQRLINLLAIK